MKNVLIKKMDVSMNKFMEDMLLNIRKSDLEEFYDLGGDNFKGELMNSILSSTECYCALSDKDEVLAIYGIVAMDINIVWALGTTRFKQYKREFLVKSLSTIRNWLEKYGEMSNVVSVKNEDSIRWLSWLGAEFKEPVNGGLQFRIRKE